GWPERKPKLGLNGDQVAVRGANVDVDAARNLLGCEAVGAVVIEERSDSRQAGQAVAFGEGVVVHGRMRSDRLGVTGPRQDCLQKGVVPDEPSADEHGTKSSGDLVGWARLWRNRRAPGCAAGHGLGAERRAEGGARG